MTGYLIPVGCPQCQGELEHVTRSRAQVGSEARAIVRCVPCRRRWQLSVFLRPA